MGRLSSRFKHALLNFDAENLFMSGIACAAGILGTILVSSVIVHFLNPDNSTLVLVGFMFRFFLYLFGFLGAILIPLLIIIYAVIEDQDSEIEGGEK